MSQDLYQYLQWLQMFMQSQEQRITALEQVIANLQDQLKNIEEKKSIHVDKIEYKFDQLKVERLEGTLNIGLNPNDLSEIDDFAIQNQTLSTPFSPETSMRAAMKIEGAIHQYLETELPLVIEDNQRKLAIPSNQSYYSFIKQDILKQLPNRIDYHIKVSQTTNHQDESSDKIIDDIITALKQEINNGVHVFLSNLPDDVKGMSSE
ncbi:spore germination protein GerPC [Bacillus rubiinfantis]|uniref:spore germination protein GerPC n=1 Tax=Bacillus rubiinfantis TaxID=1499680 RepID=UPI0005A86702|nr:spore germination protein GerPC [Bacillus rubiinfantis]